MDRNQYYLLDGDLGARYEALLPRIEKYITLARTVPPKDAFKYNFVCSALDHNITYYINKRPLAPERYRKLSHKFGLKLRMIECFDLSVS